MYVHAQSRPTLCGPTDCSLPGSCLCNLWTAVCQALLSMEFSGKKYWSRLPSPPPGEPLDPGMEPEPHTLAGAFFTTVPSGKPYLYTDKLAFLSMQLKSSLLKARFRISFIINYTAQKQNY